VGGVRDLPAPTRRLQDIVTCNGNNQVDMEHVLIVARAARSRRPCRAARTLFVNLAVLFMPALIATIAPTRAWSTAAAAASPVQVFPAAPVQGDTLVVLVSDPGRGRVAVRFDGAPEPVFDVGGGRVRALVGTDPAVAPGAHTIRATITGEGGTERRFSVVVHLLAGRFLVRRLTLPPKTFGLITPRNLAIEARALTPVLNRRTPVAWWRGPFRPPSTGPIDSPYGEQGVYNGHREWWHQGVDFAASAGAPVTAPNAGVVALARALPLGGNTIVIDHGEGVLTEYLHLSAFAVREGDRVEQGTVIGRIGATGLVTGPSLHWGLYVNGVPVDPLFWLSPRPGLTQ
jgi:murein DD-endopeptidase MepM/ murein hydrolase activator NlpD